MFELSIVLLSSNRGSRKETAFMSTYQSSNVHLQKFSNSVLEEWVLMGLYFLIKLFINLWGGFIDSRYLYHGGSQTKGLYELFLGKWINMLGLF